MKFQTMTTGKITAKNASDPTTYSSFAGIAIASMSTPEYVKENVDKLFTIAGDSVLTSGMKRIITEEAVDDV